MNRPPPISAPWPAAPPAVPTRLQPAGHEIQLLSAWLISKSEQPVTHGPVAPVATGSPGGFHHSRGPPTGSLKLIIGILQHNLKTCAFCAHSEHFAPGRLEICRVGAHPHQNRRQKTDHALVAGKVCAAARPSPPNLVEVHPVSISAGNTV